MAMEGALSQSEREPDFHAEWLRGAFLNFDILMTAPRMVQPGIGAFDRAAEVDSLKGIFDGLIKLAQGGQKELELLHFVVAQNQRHTRQLKNI